MTAKEKLFQHGTYMATSDFTGVSNDVLIELIRAAGRAFIAISETVQGPRNDKKDLH